MDIERAMAFIVDHQAKFAVEMQRLQEGFAEMRENQIQLQKHQLASEQKWERNQQLLAQATLGLTENLDLLTGRVDRLTEHVDRMAEAQQRADDRLAEFVRHTNDRFAKVESQVDDLRRPN